MMQILQKIIDDVILADTHTHLNEQVFDLDRNELVERALDVGIKYIIDVGVDLQTSKKAYIYSCTNPFVYSTFGLHPEVCIKGSDMYIENEEKIFNHFETIRQWYLECIDKQKERIQMVGETGIDAYWMEKNNVDSDEFNRSLDTQKTLFRKHIELACETSLPLTVHSRNAIDICLNELKNFGGKVVFHCLTPDIQDDKESFYRKVNMILEHGFYISINGIFTFKNAHILRNTYLEVLREKNTKKSLTLFDVYKSGFIFETDAPFLAPEGRRGERNEPQYIRLILKFLQNNY